MKLRDLHAQAERLNDELDALDSRIAKAKPEPVATDAEGLDVRLYDVKDLVDGFTQMLHFTVTNGASKRSHRTWFNGEAVSPVVRFANESHRFTVEADELRRAIEAFLSQEVHA